MAAGTLTIGIPGGGASDFATTPIPSLVLSRSAPDTPLAARSELGYATLSGRSNWGTPQVTGPAYTTRYSWTVAAMVTEAQARQIGALAKWQDAAYKASTDGALRLIDEVERLDSEASPHSRTLLSSTAEAWNASYVYGYGVFAVKLELPEDWRAQAGQWASGAAVRLVQFVLLEL